MRDPDQIILSGLRPFSPLTDTQWSIVVQEVAKAGDINKVTGTVKQEIIFAKHRFRTLKAKPIAVEKHPGHADTFVDNNF